MTIDPRNLSGPPRGETYGEAVRRLLSARGSSQRLLAAHVGKSEGNVSKILSDKDPTYSPTDVFHAAVLTFLGLDSEQARYLEPLYEAARNAEGVNYWQDQTSRLRLTVDEYSLRVEEATQGRDAAQGALAELQEQLGLLNTEMERVNHDAAALAQEHSALRARTKQQKNKYKHKLDQATAYARAQETERLAAEEQARALGREVVVLQRQVRLLQEEQAGHQPVARVAIGTSYQEAAARARARKAHAGDAAPFHPAAEPVSSPASVVPALGTDRPSVTELPNPRDSELRLRRIPHSPSTRPRDWYLSLPPMPEAEAGRTLPPGRGVEGTPPAARLPVVSSPPPFLLPPPEAEAEAGAEAGRTLPPGRAPQVPLSGEPAASGARSVPVEPADSLSLHGGRYCLAALTAGTLLVVLTAFGFLSGAWFTYLAPVPTDMAEAWHELEDSFPFWRRWSWAGALHAWVYLLVCSNFFVLWYVLYEKAYRFMFGTDWTRISKAGLPTRTVFRLSRLTYPGSGRFDPRLVMLVYGTVAAVVLSMTADLAPLGQRIDEIIHWRF